MTSPGFWIQQSLPASTCSKHSLQANSRRTVQLCGDLRTIERIRKNMQSVDALGQICHFAGDCQNPPIHGLRRTWCINLVIGVIVRTGIDNSTIVSPLLGKGKGARLAVGEVVLLEREEKHSPCRLKNSGQHVVSTSVCLDVAQIGEDDFGDLLEPAKS